MQLSQLNCQGFWWMFLISLCYISTTIIISSSSSNIIIIVIVITLMEPSHNLIWITWHIELIISSFILFPHMWRKVQRSWIWTTYSHCQWMGPSVNWNFVELLQEEHREQCGRAQLQTTFGLRKTVLRTFIIELIYSRDCLKCWNCYYSVSLSV